MQAEQTSEAKIPTNRGFSLIQDCGRYNSSCGYCKEEDSSVSTGMHAHRLTVYDYQELLDQGWRRSGKFLYKPDNQTTCCRQYTIRLDVTEYQPAKAHRKLLRKWEHYLAGTHRQEQPAQQQQALSSPNSPGASDHDLDRHTASPKRPRKEGGSSSSTPQHQQHQQHHHHQQQQQDLGSQAAQQLDEVRLLLQAAVTELDAAVSSGCNVSTQLLSAVKVLPVLPQQQQQQHHKQHHKHRQPLQHGTCCSSPCALALAAAVRKHSSSMQQQAATGSNSSSSSSSVWLEPEQLADSLAGRFNSLAAQAQQPLGLTAAACKGHINFLVTQQQQQQAQQQDGGMQPPAAPQQQHQQHKLQQRKQHQQQPSASGQQQLPQQQQQQQQQEHVLEVRMVPNQFIEEEFVLWQRYQASQHHDPPDALTPKHYKGFLVDTPLIHVPPPTAAEPPGQQHQQQQQAAGRKQQAAAAAAAAGGGSGMPSCGYGSFHQQYWLDGKLVAVGVVDVLPRCLSSKYFFWDPDYAHLSLGRYGALREISWIQSQHASGASDLRFYYLGYYIHTCPKMAYKAEYSPCELLCPQRQVWVRYDDTVRRALDNAPYVVLSDLPGVQMQPNLSVPRVPPASPKPVSPAQQGAGARLLGALGLGGAFASLGAAFTGSQGTDHTQQQQQEQQGLDVQLGLLGGAGVVSMPEHLSVEQQVQQRQRERQALDAQLLFVMRQPVRWAALRDSGMLDDQGITFMEERLTAWRAAVGETARTLLYAAAQDLI